MIGNILPEILLECGIERTAPQINSTDYEMAQIRAMMNAAGRDIHTRAEWSRAVKDTSLSPGTATPLPSDFQELPEGGGVFPDGCNTPSRLVIDPATWQMLSQRASSTACYAHIMGGNVYTAPDVTSGTLRYVSKHWLVGDKSVVTSNEDETRFPEHLLARGTIYRWRRQKGMPYEDLLAEFEADLEAAARADRGA